MHASRVRKKTVIKLSSVLCPTTCTVSARYPCRNEPAVRQLSCWRLGHGKSEPTQIESTNILSVSSIPAAQCTTHRSRVSVLVSFLSTRRRRRQVHGRGRGRRISRRRRRRGRNGISVLLDERVKTTRETGRGAARRRRGRQAGRSSADSRRSTRRSARSPVSPIAWVSAICGLRGHGLVPRSGARGGGSGSGATVRALSTRIIAVASVAAIRAAVATVPIAVAAVASPWSRTTRRTSGRTVGRRAAVVAVVVPRTPGSRAAGRAACPRPGIAAASAASSADGSISPGPGFDARRSSTGATQFLHELLWKGLAHDCASWKGSLRTSYSRSTASPPPMRGAPGAPGRTGPSLRQLAPRCLSGQSRAIWPALPQTRQMMLAV
jgi:hypothetical protein